jgi:hypothetical protein
MVLVDRIALSSNALQAFVILLYETSLFIIECKSYNHKEHGAAKDKK